MTVTDPVRRMELDADITPDMAGRAITVAVTERLRPSAARAARRAGLETTIRTGTPMFSDQNHGHVWRRSNRPLTNNALPGALP